MRWLHDQAFMSACTAPLADHSTLMHSRAGLHWTAPVYEAALRCNKAKNGSFLPFLRQRLAQMHSTPRTESRAFSTHYILTMLCAQCRGLSGLTREGSARRVPPRLPNVTVRAGAHISETAILLGSAAASVGLPFVWGARRRWVPAAFRGCYSCSSNLGTLQMYKINT
jgi:hypothetical protein